MDKKKIVLTVVVFVLLIVFIILLLLLLNKYILKESFENSITDFSSMNSESVFKIESMILFSSADAKNKTSSANHFTVQNSYQYTDIAIFIKPISSEITAKNSLKEVYIENIKYEKSPEIRNT